MYNECHSGAESALMLQLAGIALKLIPNDDGVAERFFSAGAKIIDGLSVTDVADYAFTFSAEQVSCGVVQSFSDHNFRKPGTVICPEALDRLDETERYELIRFTESCGYQVQELWRLFDRRIKSEATRHHAQLSPCTAVQVHVVIVSNDFGDRINSKDCEGSIEDQRAIHPASKRDVLYYLFLWK